MENAKAKSINLLLHEGDLNGVITIEDTSWNSGVLYSAPRNAVNQLLSMPKACNKYGIYLLLSQDMVYVGQSSDLAKRISQHLVGKAWWNQVVVLTTKDDSFDRADIDFLEAILIKKAQSVGRLDCDNKNKGNPPRSNDFRRVFLGQYLDEALFLMRLIGITAFVETTPQKSTKQKRKSRNITPNSPINKVPDDKIKKPNAIQLIEENGHMLCPNISFATKQSKRPEYWINPPVSMLAGEWDIILNNPDACELILIHIPAYTFSLKEDGQHGFCVRKDKRQAIEMKIDPTTFIETRSRIDLSPYISTKVKYCR